MQNKRYFQNERELEEIEETAELLEELMKDYKKCLNKERELEASGHYSRIDPDDFDEIDYNLQVEKKEIEEMIKNTVEEKKIY